MTSSLPPTGNTIRLDPTHRDTEGAAAPSTRESLLEVLEAFEDVAESEVGDTTMARARNIERETGLCQLHLKLEGGNPTGTHKDRIAYAQVGDALRRGFDVLTAATCGNYGVALAMASKTAGLRCQIFVPERNHSRRLAEIESFGATIERTPGDYEATVVASSEAALQHEWYDANPGGENTKLQLTAYGEIAYEIYDDLRDAPAAVACPLSNGTLLAGLYRGFASLHRRGKTSRIPRLVGGSARGQNPIVEGFASGERQCPELPPDSLHESETNEPLINWHSIDGDLALEALHASKGWVCGVSDRALERCARELRRREGLSVLPAATAGLEALIWGHRQEALPSDRYVVVLTGRR